MSLENSIARLQRFLARIQRALHFRRSPVGATKARARGKLRAKVINMLHI